MCVLRTWQRESQIQFHRGTFISSDRVNVSQPLLVQNAGLPQILKAHGALMLTAWMTTGPAGMATARFLRGAFKGRRLGGKDVWFVVHVGVMSLTVAASVVAFILPFCHLKAWSGGVHPVLGCLLMILSVLQSSFALLRCGPQHPLRFVFNWSHAVSGAVIRVLAVSAVFTGLDVMDRSSERWLMKVMGGFVGWETLLYVLLELWKSRRNDSSEVLGLQKTRVSVLLLAAFLMGSLAFLVSLLVGIGTS